MGQDGSNPGDCPAAPIGCGIPASHRLRRASNDMHPHALVFDAYGTLYGAHSAGAQCERYWPGKGDAPDVAPYYTIIRLSDLPPLLA